MEIELLGSEVLSGLSCGCGLGCVHPHPVLVTSFGNRMVLLYYTPYPPDEAELPFLAYSFDGKRFFTGGFYSNPLFGRGRPGSWDDHHLADIDVVYYNGMWMMFYAGATIVDGVKKVSIGRAVSRDGFSWKKDREPVLSPDVKSQWERGTDGIISVATPSVIPLKNRLLMYYEGVGEDGVSRILLAESFDGKHFQRKGMVLEPFADWNKKGVNHPHVSFIDDEKIIMLYVGFDGNCYSLGYTIYEARNSLKPIYKPSRPLLRANRIYCTSIYNRISKVTRKTGNALFNATIRSLTDKNIDTTRMMGYLHAYRSAFLTTPDRKIVYNDKKHALLYVTLYDKILLVPTIRLMKARLKDFD